MPRARRIRQIAKSKKQPSFLHINYALVFKKHTPMYLLHKFWSRKPHNIVSEYINAYTNPNDIVLDPFCGSGVTAIEAIRAGRKAVAVDCDPIATLVTRMTAMPLDLEKFKQTFSEISKAVKSKIIDLYRIKCPDCGDLNSAISKSLVISYVVKCPKCHNEVIMGQAKKAAGKQQNIYLCTHASCGKEFSLASMKLEREEYLEVKYECEICNGKGVLKNPAPTYIRKEPKKIDEWYPTVNLLYPNAKPFRTRRRGHSIESLYTKTNLKALAILYDAISNIQDDIIKDFFLFTFSSMLHLTSRLIMLKRGVEAGWNVPEYLIPSFHPEYNVWDRFENRFKAVLRGKVESNDAIKFYKEAKKYDDLHAKKKNANIFIARQSVTNLRNILNNSIDYVFTDPPYGGSIQYYELDMLRAAWLAGNKGDSQYAPWWEEEITINSNQGKSEKHYHNRLHSAFREIYRVLKPNKYMTITFHNTDIAIYNSIIRATVFAGFELEKIIYQPTEHISSKAGFHPYTSAVGDFYIRFKKPARQIKQISDREIDEERAKKIVFLVLTKILAERGEPTTFTDILKGQSHIYQELRNMGYLFFGANPDNIENVLKENQGKEFVFIEGRGWWFKEPHKHHLSTPLDDRVEEAVVQRLRREVSTFDDILQEIYLTFTNSLTPNPSSVKSILEEYGEKSGDGKWRLKPEVSSSISEHSMIIAYLATLGREYGYDVWIGSRERSETFQKKSLSSWGNLEKLELKDCTQNQIEQYLRQIDVIWIKNNIPYYAIEVEYSTAVTEAFNRCSNLPDTKYDIHRVMIIPKERERMLSRKLNSELLKERMEKDQWEFIFFNSFVDFYLKSRDNPNLSESDFLALSVLPQESRDMPQYTLDQFNPENGGTAT